MSCLCDVYVVELNFNTQFCSELNFPDLEILICRIGYDHILIVVYMAYKQYIILIWGRYFRTNFRTFIKMSYFPMRLIVFFRYVVETIVRSKIF
jgi:hypothetical protein